MRYGAGVLYCRPAGLGLRQDQQGRPAANRGLSHRLPPRTLLAPSMPCPLGAAPCSFREARTAEGARRQGRVELKLVVLLVDPRLEVPLGPGALPPGVPLAPSPAGGASDGARGAGNGQPQASDAEAMGLLEEMGMPFLVVATKTDKLSSRSPCPSRAPGGGVSARRSSTRAGSPPRAGSVDPPPPISSAAPANAGGASVVECACAGV